jgi:hypothetical protein
MELIYQHKAAIQVAGQDLAPLGDRTLTKADLDTLGIKAFLQPLSGDSNGQEVHLELPKGLLAAKSPASLQGWKMVVGFRAAPEGDELWSEAKPRTIQGDSGSGKESFKLELPNAPEAIQQNRNLEIRLFNERGVPAQRLLIPFKELPWGPGGECGPSAS